MKLLSRSKKTSVAPDKKPVVSASRSQKEQADIVLGKPVVSEKTATLASARTYTFFVNLKSTRTAVASAIATRYGIRPMRVRIIRGRAEPVRHGRFSGKERAYKKALVTLPEGKTLDIYAGV